MKEMAERSDAFAEDYESQFKKLQREYASDKFDFIKNFSEILAWETIEEIVCGQQTRAIKGDPYL